MEQENNITQNTEVIQTEIKDAVKDAIKEIKNDEIKATSNTTTVKLPSNGLINPNITEVTLRRMSVKESKTLFTSKDPNYLNTIITSCIVEPSNITNNDLHPNDIIYLTFILRYISSPKNVTIKCLCTNPDCERTFDAQVKVPELKVNYATPETYKYTVKLPDSNDIIGFKVLSEGDLIQCEKITERHIRQRSSENLSNDDIEWLKSISKIAHMIQTKNDLDFETFDKKLEYLESLSAYDFALFNKAYNDIISSFGLDRTFTAKCSHCGEEVEVQAYIAPDFFQLV